MKVNGPGGPSAPNAARRSGRPTAEGFSIGGSSATGSAAAPARTGMASGVGSLEALLALQDVEGPLERKRRAVGRASRILDVLDELKLSLLDGGLSEGSLTQLTQAVRTERAQTQDIRLEGVLDEIETRAAVELAKWELRRAA